MWTLILDVVFLLLGISIVLWGADKFTDGASSIARRWNVSEMVIGLTVVSMGTSMPEFVVSLFSALEGSGEMSVGNVVGSNIFNIFFILGTSATVTPLKLAGISQIDMYVMLGSAILLWAVSFGDYKVRRFEGILMIALYVAYTTYLVLQAV